MQRRVLQLAEGEEEAAYKNILFLEMLCKNAGKYHFVFQMGFPANKKETLISHVIRLTIAQAVK